MLLVENPVDELLSASIFIITSAKLKNCSVRSISSPNLILIYKYSLSSQTLKLNSSTPCESVESSI